MRIVLLIDDYLPSEKSAPLMFRQLGKAFVELGHQVWLFTPSIKIRNRFEEELDENGMQVIRFRNGALKNISFVLRAINESLIPFNFFLALLKYKKSIKADCIIAYSPTIFWGIAVWILKRIWKCPSYLILRDIFPQWTIDSGLMHKYYPPYWYFKSFEFLNYCSFNRIGVQTSGNLKYFSGSIFEHKTEVLNNWFKLEEKNCLESDIRKKYKLEGKVIYFFGGNIGQAQDMMNIVRLADKMKMYTEAHFLLIGRGNEWNLVAEESKKLGLNNLTILPSVSQKEYYRILKEIDVGLFSLNQHHKTQNFPGKVLGYMAFRKPILGSVNMGNDLINILRENHAGLVSVNPDDTSFLNNAIRLLQAPDLRKKMGDSAYRYLEEFCSPESVCKQMLRITE